MWRGFKEFFLRGNVIHLSVAVIIGTSFTALVTVVANNWISPLIAAFGGQNPNGLAVTLVAGNFRSVMDFGAIITALIVFAIVATTIYYLVVLPVKEMQLKRAWAARSRPPLPTEVELLADIRGLLAQQQYQELGMAVPSAPGRRVTPQQTGTNLTTVEVTEGFATRVVVFPGDIPGLLVEYGGNQLAFTVGRGVGAVVSAHEFAVGLAYAALAFASRCRIQMTPQQAQAAQPARTPSETVAKKI